MLFRRIIFVYSENHLMHMNTMLFTLYEQNAEFFNATVTDKYSNNCTFRELVGK
jgi:hypothetical protein